MSSPPTILDRLLEISLLFHQDLARAFGGTPLTISRVHLLWVVHRVGPTTQAALAAELDVTARNVTGLVDALEAAGYVERRPHPADRRAVLVTLTDKGHATTAAMEQDREQLAAALTDGMDGDRRAQLDSDLALIAGRLQQLVASAEETRS